MINSFLTKIYFERTGRWNRYYMKTVPNIGDEVYVLEGDGSSTLIKVFKIRYLADRGSNKTEEAGIYCDLVIWGQEIEGSKAQDSDFI